MKKLLIVAIFSSILFTCTQEEITSRQYPRVRTNSVTNITSSGALFNGEIYYAPSQIVDHGFIWSTSKTLTIQNSDRISLGHSEGVGHFGILTERSLAEGKKYYVKAYAQSKSHLVYGDVVEFISLGSNAPVLSSIEPKTGTWGDTIILVGLNFSSIISTNTVKFAEHTAQIISASEDTIKSIIPVQLNKSIANVSISFDGNISELANAFELKPPVINLISPDEGSSKTSVEISGVYFNLVNTKVFFGTKEAKITSANRTKIICEVPSELPFGAIPIKVQTGEVELFAINTFFVQAPRIFDIVPISASILDTISIEGDFFGSEPELNIVRFDDEHAQIVSATKTKIEVIVPAYVNSVKPKISIDYNGSKDESIGLFSMRPPEITNYPTYFTGLYEPFIIHGNYFNPYIINQVYLGSEQLTIDVVSFTEIQVRLPYYINTHSLPLKVTWKDQETIGDEPIKSKWIRLDDSPANFSQSILLPFNNKAYIGLNSVYPATDIIWEYDPTTKNWQEYTNFPGGQRYGSLAFVIGSKAYVGGGDNASDPTQSSNDFWTFDFNSKTWTQLNDLPFSGNVFGFVSNNKGFAIEDTGVQESKLWLYDSSEDKWIEENSNLDFNVYNLNGVSGFELNGLFYLFDSFLSLREFNPMSGQWQITGSVPNSNIYNNPVAFSFVIDSQIYIGTKGLELWKYNPITHQWTDEGLYMGERRESSLGFSANGKGYVISGYTFGIYGEYFQSLTCLEFDPSY